MTLYYGNFKTVNAAATLAFAQTHLSSVRCLLTEFMQDMLPDFIFSMMAHQEERSMDGRVRTLPAIVSRVDLLYWFLCITANFKSDLDLMLLGEG